MRTALPWVEHASLIWHAIHSAVGWRADKFSALQSNDDEDIEQVKADGRGFLEAFVRCRDPQRTPALHRQSALPFVASRDALCSSD